jgi:hypothetical protein
MNKHLNYTWLKHQIKKNYNINLDDLPSYQTGIIKYLYMIQAEKFPHTREEFRGFSYHRKIDNYILGVIKND